MQLRPAVLSASVLVSVRFLFAYASPLTPEYDGNQAPLTAPANVEGPVYEDGELPPLVDTEGWIDPRLNGGRFLDVSLELMRLNYCSHFSLFLVHH